MTADHSARDDSGLSPAEAAADVAAARDRAVRARRIRGFYAVLDRDDPDLAERLVGGAAAAAPVLQLRLKPPGPPPDTRALVDAARRARAVAHRHGALFVVNDRLDVALAVEADGVHLGQDDLPLADARALAVRAGRSDLLIGVSTHGDAQVSAAVAGGADYLGFGPVYGTRTKQNPDPVQGIQGLARAVALAGDVGVVAIGGVTPEVAAVIAATGAAAACAIGAVNQATDPARAGRTIGDAWRA